MGRRTRECYLCNCKYEYCPTCSQDRMKPAFMAEFHSENCKNIFQICTDFNLGLQSKSEAKAALEQCDLSNKSNFKSFVQTDIENIFKEEPKFKKGKKFEMPIIEEAAPEIFQEPAYEVVTQENK